MTSGSDSTSAHYTVLARRFRPQRFDEVVGQQPVAQALKNAIRNDRVAHGYLFTGARGVGKTSMARILAKSLNCRNRTEGDDGEPCNECDICQSIAAGQDVDVLEIDGASNRGIDDIRALRANVSVKSMRTKYKMYIIDEVHMLTKEAFNALLKTLEEPPPSVKFVFCTTEPNKVPDTILSRCQRFDFATIETQNIMTRLQSIAEAEGYQVDAEALELVARRANGSMRDSQSLFDQLLAFGDEHITATDVHRLFGTADDEQLLRMLDAAAAGERQVLLEGFDASLGGGVQLGEVVDQLLNCLRDLMLLHSGADSVPLLGVSSQRRDAMAGIAQKWSLSAIMAGLEIVAETKTRMQRVSFGRALAELALVRLSTLENLSGIEQLLESAKAGVFPAGTASVAAPQAITSETKTPSTASPQPPRPTEPQAKTRSESTVEAASPETKKKIDENPQVEAEATTAEVETAQKKTNLINLASASPKDVLTEVVGRLGGTVKAQIEHASLAISEPNALAFRFPANYHFGKSYCEKPEVRSKIERAVIDSIGQPVRIEFTIEATEDSASSGRNGSGSKPNTSTAISSRAVPIASDEVIEDEFVRDVIETFGAIPMNRRLTRRATNPSSNEKPSDDTSTAEPSDSTEEGAAGSEAGRD